MDPDQITPGNYPYHLSSEGRILDSGMRGELAPSKKALPADAVGSLDWTLQRMFSTREMAIDMLESLMQGVEADPLIYQFCATYRQWEKDFQEGKLDEMPNLNQVSFRIKLDEEKVMSLLTEGMKRLAGKLSTVRASQLSPQAIEAAGQFAMEPEGYKDRELILKVSGVISDQKGIQITNNNNSSAQAGVKVETNIKIPEAVSKRFQETVHEIDDSVRVDVFTESNREK